MQVPKNMMSKVGDDLIYIARDKQYIFDKNELDWINTFIKILSTINCNKNKILLDGVYKH